jgi:uncharacterized protein YecE (DUF72 family)
MLASGWYPAHVKTSESRLRYYAEHFPIVEVDATYYALPRADLAGKWVERTPKEFVFDVKAFGPMTGHATDPKALPADLRAQVPGELLSRGRVYPRQLPPDLLGEIWTRFCDALLPLESAGKLGVVLFQYPEWFMPSHASRDEILRARERCPYPIAVEFRNAAWAEPDTLPRTTSLLREAGIPFTCVDMPQGFRSSLPPMALATSERTALVRFHGRDPKAWTTKAPKASERFRYLYRQEELAEWVPRIRTLAAHAGEVHVLMNNCYRDNAVINAGQLSYLLGQDEVIQPRE